MSTIADATFDNFIALVHEIANDRANLVTEDDRARLHDYAYRVKRHRQDTQQEIAAHKKPDRSALLRMAGNIAGGLLADPQSPSVYGNGIDAPNRQTNRDKVAEAALDIARRIMQLTDEGSK